MLNTALTAQYKATNDRAAGNPHLKLRKDGMFHIATPALDARDTDPLGNLFPQRHDVALAQVLETVNNHCNMLQSFEHWQQTHVRQATSHPALLAGIMGLGCGIGVRKMARISSSVTESELDHTVNWRFSLENIRSANDAVVKAMDGMKLPNLYRQTRDQLHTASDGQKFEVRGDSLHASQSFKYFGQGQGVSAYTFIDERNFLWHYIDDLALRQAIEKQLNKVELADRFTRAIAVGNPREYTQTEKEEQEIAEARNRLIRNSIICWNYLYLAKQIEKAPDVEARENLLRLIAVHSPLSWTHINMLGEYDVSEEKLRDQLGVLPPKNVA